MMKCIMALLAISLIGLPQAAQAQDADEGDAAIAGEPNVELVQRRPRSRRGRGPRRRRRRRGGPARGGSVMRAGIYGQGMFLSTPDNSPIEELTVGFGFNVLYHPKRRGFGFYGALGFVPADLSDDLLDGALVGLTLGTSYYIDGLGVGTLRDLFSLDLHAGVQPYVQFASSGVAGGALLEVGPATHIVFRGNNVRIELNFIAGLGGTASEELAVFPYGGMLRLGYMYNLF